MLQPRAAGHRKASGWIQPASQQEVGLESAPGSRDPQASLTRLERRLRKEDPPNVGRGPRGAQRSSTATPRLHRCQGHRASHREPGTAMPSLQRLLWAWFPSPAPEIRPGMALHHLPRRGLTSSPHHPGWRHPNPKSRQSGCRALAPSPVPPAILGRSPCDSATEVAFKHYISCHQKATMRVKSKVQTQLRH